MMRGSIAFAMAALCACAEPPPLVRPQHESALSPQVAESAPSQHSCKPEAPIAITLASHPLQTGRYELTITATPTKAVDSVELALVLPPGAHVDRGTAKFGATQAAQPRVLVATVETRDRTAEIAAVARVPVAASNAASSGPNVAPPIMMSRSTTIALGDPTPQPHVRQYMLPDGERAREVQP